jgi:hypothetical protein
MDETRYRMWGSRWMNWGAEGAFHGCLGDTGSRQELSNRRRASMRLLHSSTGLGAAKGHLSCTCRFEAAHSVSSTKSMRRRCTHFNFKTRFDQACTSCSVRSVDLVSGLLPAPCVLSFRRLEENLRHSACTVLVNLGCDGKRSAPQLLTSFNLQPEVTSRIVQPIKVCQNSHCSAASFCGTAPNRVSTRIGIGS